MEHVQNLIKFQDDMDLKLVRKLNESTINLYHLEGPAKAFLGRDTFDHECWSAHYKYVQGHPFGAGNSSK